mgnify:CR=1 FL=1
MTASSTCSCPCAGSVDPMRVAGFAAGVGATVAWYALPDYVRSRPLRGLVKVGLLGVLGWSMVAQLPEGAELPPYDDEDVDCSKSSRSQARIHWRASRRRIRPSWRFSRARRWVRR